MRSLRRQLKEIVLGGTPVLRRKAIRVTQYFGQALLFLLLSPIVAVCFLLLALIKRWVHIRFSYFKADRIGHYVFDFAHYCAERSIEASNRSIDLFFLERPGTNPYLDELVREKLYCFTWTFYFYHFARSIKPLRTFIFFPAIKTIGSRDVQGVLRHQPPFFRFNAVKQRLGEEFLLSKGINPKKYAVLIVRDDAYLAARLGDFSYHSYRNSDIRDYEGLIRWLINKGYGVVRLGSTAETRAFEGIVPDGFLDYPFAEKKDPFLDVFIAANATVCISTGSGLDSLCDVNLVPILYLNYLPLAHFNSWSASAVTVPKILFRKSDNLTLSLHDYFRANYLRTDLYDKFDVSFDSLSTDQLVSACKMFVEGRIDEFAVDQGELIQLIAGDSKLSSLHSHTIEGKIVLPERLYGSA